MIINIDVKSLEWCTYLFLSQDQVGIEEWIQVLEDPTKNDIHTANQVAFNLPSRLISKIFLFRWIYRGSAYAYSKDPDFTSVSKSQDFWQSVIDNYYSKYQSIYEIHLRYIYEATTTGKIISPTGRTYLFVPKQTYNGLKYNLGEKIHTIKEKYWDQGIDTDKIPIEELIKYGIQDVELSYAVFLEQVKRFSTTDQHLFPLFRLQCNDLLVLQEMEWNGLIYDEESSLEKSKEIESEIEKVEQKLDTLLDYPEINYNSNDDLSLILYGGIKKSKTRVPTGFYKTGLKAGQVKYRLLDTTKMFPRLVTPIKGSELLKEGFYSTDEPTLRTLVPNAHTKKIITLLLERAKLEKINGTYLKGLPKLREKMHWPPNKLYSNLNQCVVITSRLSSTKPNQQNLAPLAKQFFISRYD